MLGSKNRDYKTGDRWVAVALDWHKGRMDALIAEGMAKEDASNKAFHEYRQMTKAEKNKLYKEWREKHW